MTEIRVLPALKAHSNSLATGLFSELQKISLSWRHFIAQIWRMVQGYQGHWAIFSHFFWFRRGKRHPQRLEDVLANRCNQIPGHLALFQYHFHGTMCLWCLIQCNFLVMNELPRTHYGAVSKRVKTSSLYSFNTILGPLRFLFQGEQLGRERRTPTGFPLLL